MPLFRIRHFFQSMHALTLSITLACSFGSTSVQANATAESNDYQQILKEQRQWAGLSTKTLRVGDVVWSYSEGGSKERPTLLLLHGLAGCRDTWNPVARQLTRTYHVVIPDLPSCGSTHIPKEFDLSLPNITEQLRRFVETAGIQNNLHVAGHSVGGTVALFYASKYAFDTQSLFLISTGGLFKSNSTPYLNNPVYLKQLLVNQPGDLNFVTHKVMFSPPFVPESIKKLQEKSLMAQSAESAKLITELYEMNQQSSITSFNSMLKSIEAPTLILWGNQDQVVNPEVAFEIKSLIKHAQTPIMLNNVGHIAILEVPERVTESYLDFLNQIQFQNKSAPKPQAY